MDTAVESTSRASFCNIRNPKVKVASYAVLAIASRVAFFIATPLWLDFFNSKNSTSADNRTLNADEPKSSKEYYYDLTETVTSEGNASKPACAHTPNPFFTVLGQWTFSMVTFGLCLLLTLVVRPQRIRNDAQRSYPMRNFVIIGTSQGLSSILMAYSISGSRTPPYLQAVLVNCVIPIQFVVRFLVLRKRPTLLKAICAATVVLCEFVCLIPTIFPSLENEHEHHEEGGSTGADRILWPIFFVVSSIPFALANSIMERGVKTQKPSQTSEEQATNVINGGVEDEQDQSRDHLSAKTSTSPQSTQQLNLIFFNFWCSFFVWVTLLFLFWFDILPVFGTSHSITEFGCQMWFNLQCLFGGANCTTAISLLGWIDFCSVFFANVAFAGLMRHSEGANFVMILMTVRTPIIFIFWTLFVEQPFSWQPHAGLSTWLSIGSIVVMVAAIVLYDLAPHEVDVRASRRTEAVDDERPLIAESTSTNG